MTLADRIREFVRSNYAEPARQRGVDRFSVVVSDVHRAMKLSNRFPGVCSALQSEALQAECGISLIDWTGPPQGSTSTATFVFQPLRTEGGTEVEAEPCDTPFQDVESSVQRTGWRRFQDLARRRMEEHYGVALSETSVPGVPKKFDYVSPGGTLVGDAKYLTLVRGQAEPPAKNMEIAGHVWLLEKTGAKTTFLVFGNQRDVALGWLERYGTIAGKVQFHILAADGALERLR